jgi:hypothetical protein
MMTRKKCVYTGYWCHTWPNPHMQIPQTKATDCIVNDIIQGCWWWFALSVNVLWVSNKSCNVRHGLAREEQQQVTTSTERRGWVHQMPWLLSTQSRTMMKHQQRACVKAPSWKVCPLGWGLSIIQWRWSSAWHSFLFNSQLKNVTWTLLC